MLFLKNNGCLNRKNLSIEQERSKSVAKIIVENNRDFFNCSRAMDHKRLGVRMLLSMTLLLTSAFVRELCPVRVSFKQTILSHALTSSNAERKLSDLGEHLKEPIPLLAFFDNAANDQSIQVRNYCLQTRESPPRRRGFPIYHECWQISVEMRRKRYISTSCHNSYCKKSLCWRKLSQLAHCSWRDNDLDKTRIISLF